jgi:hypothetical protein
MRDRAKKAACGVTTAKGQAKPRFSVPEAESAYRHSIKWDRIREQLAQTVERARRKEARSPLRMWERQR